MLEHDDIDWSQRPRAGWEEFVAARRRYMDGRAWDALIRRLEREAQHGAEPGGTPDDEGPDGEGPQPPGLA